MSRSKPKRRWLQFSLRSVLVLTLAVALWLGYEVHQARHVERTVAALQDLGGSAECELTGWSLLRLCRVPGYGRRIVRVEIPGCAEAEGDYEGEELEKAWTRRWRAFWRLRKRALNTYPGVVVFAGEAYSTRELFTLRYFIVRLPDDSLAEILSGREFGDPAPGREACFALLVVDDKCVDIHGFATPVGTNPEIIVEDLDAEGVAELRFRWTEKLVRDHRIRQLPNDVRDWLGVYNIEHDGFKSLLPEDTSDFPRRPR